MSQPPITWDEESVKTLLFEPENLIAVEPWSSWVKKLGGMGAVRDMLRSLAVSEKHQKTLQAILNDPGASLQRYSMVLHTSVATFVRYRSALVKLLVVSLNSQGDGSPVAISAPGLLVDDDGDSPVSDEPQLPPNNLPQRMVPLIGREKELATVAGILQRDNVSVLTISGPGGIGKTRLALQVALDALPEFNDGVFVVSLESILSTDLVLPAIVQTLGLTSADGKAPMDLLKSYLQEKHILLMLDNFEQITSAVPLLAELLAAAPRLKLLVTSRAMLHIYGEYEFKMPPLRLPDLTRLPSLPELAELPAVALFVNRVQAVKPDFTLSPGNAPIIAEICVRLDGIPLALELVAARSKLFAPQALLRELKQRFALLAYKSVDRDPRHQTLRNTVAWSYQLLAPEEQSLFTQMGVFVNGFTLEAAEVVCQFKKQGGQNMLDYLFSLVDQSILQTETREDGEPRFSLYESLREYALEQLEQTGELQHTQERHLHYMLQLVESIEPGPQEPNLPAWMNRLEEEHDNLRAAIRRALDWGEYEIALRVAGAIWRFWQIHGHIAEGARWMREMLSLTEEVSLPRAKALWGAGWLGMVMGDLDEARRYFEEGAACSRTLNNQRYLGLSLHGIGAVARAQGDFSRSHAAFEESLPLFQALRNTEDVAWTYEHLGATALDQGEFQKAAQYLEKGLALFRNLEQRWPCAEALTFLGHAALQQADYDRARQRYEEARVIYTELEDRQNIATININIGVAMFGKGQRADAVTIYKENVLILRELNNYWGIVWGVERLAEAAEAFSRPDLSVRLYGAAEALRRKTGVLWHPGFYSQYQDQRFDALKTLLGQTAWDALWEEGQNMDIDAAIANAMTL